MPLINDGVAIDRPPEASPVILPILMDCLHEDEQVYSRE